MKSRWSEGESKETIAAYHRQGVAQDLALRTYSARLIGEEPELVLHGGGNASVKSVARDLLGNEIDVVYVKPSGWDLAKIEPADYPALRLNELLPLRHLDSLSDREMLNVQRTYLVDASAPSPSVETLLHVFLPHKFIDHTHADAVLSLINQPDAAALVAEIYGQRVGIVPYIPPGFALAKAAARTYEQDPAVVGLVLIHHGICSFGRSAKESYERMIDLVTVAEEYLRPRRAVGVGGPARDVAAAARRYAAMAPRLRGALATPGEDGETWQRVVLDYRCSPDILSFLEREDLATLTQKGPPTPDHVIRTKPVPLVVRNPEAIGELAAEYRREYHQYFENMTRQKQVERTELSPSPSILLIPGIGLAGAGRDVLGARIAADLYEHCTRILTDAAACGEYQPLDRSRLFDMEYWPLELAKLGREDPGPLAGQVALITGAAGGIGAATARVLGEAGAHLVLWDLDREALETTRASLSHPERALVDAVDVTQKEAVQSGMSRAVTHFGGVDLLVSNAGKAWTASMDECPEPLLEESFAINFYSHQYLASQVARVLKLQQTGGVLLFNASKSSFNPGPDFGPYTLPKTALIALMKQYAVELGRYGIRSNAINADRIRTRLFEAGVLEARVKARNLSVDEYFKGNLLHKEVLAEDVARGFLHLALSRKTSGAVLPVDGGNIAASPR